MKKIRIEVEPEDFKDWLNEVLKENDINIDDNIEAIQTIVNCHLFDMDSTLNRQRILHELLSCDRIKSVKKLRKEKIDEIEKWKNIGE